MATKDRLISASKLVIALAKFRNGIIHYDDLLDVIANVPTVDAVKVVHGEWTMCLDIDDVEYIECPICGGMFYDGDNDTFDKPYNYCPNCGVKMDGHT